MSKIATLAQHLVLPKYMIHDDKKLANDFGAREMYGKFVRIAWPALVESVLLGIISFVDSLMVSTCGDEAIAAVGITGQPRLLFYVVLMAFSTGVNAVVARRRGEGRRDAANRTLAQTLPIMVILAIAFFGIGYVISEPLLLFAGANDDTIGMAIPYFRIIMFGQIFTAVSLCLNAAQRGCGKTSISMITSVSANVVNVIFNALLINGLFFFPKLGVTGAAIATAMGNFVAAVIAVISVTRKNGYLKLRIKEMFCHRFDTFPAVLKVVIGSSAEQVFLRIGFFLFVKMVAELSTQDYTTHTICMNVLNLSFTVGDGLGIASASLVGQHLGMGRPDKAVVYGKVGQRIGFCFGVGLLVLFSAYGAGVVEWFSDTEYVIKTGAVLMRVLAVVCPLQISQVVFSGCLRGAGDTKYMAVVSAISVAMIRPALSYLLIYTVNIGVLGAWIALLVDQILRCTFATTRFYGQKWCQIQL